MKGFFPALEVQSVKSPPLVALCSRCKLYQHCNSPKMPVNGKGKKGILIVGEAPGQNEDRQGIPFCGESGQLLEKVLGEVGINLREDCWITNSLICHPKDRRGANRTPDNREIDYCRPNLIKAVRELNPVVIVLLGASAVRSMIGWLWRDDPGPIGRWVGWRIPSQRLNAWICPTWHPAYLSRLGSDGEAYKLFKRHLCAACLLNSRPWNDVPKYTSRVRVVLEPSESAKLIAEFHGDRPIAVDYETDRLKPDSPDARIISCALSDGKRTIAYPWHGPTIEATGKLLASGTPIIASNLKFEERWTRRIFGHGVKNWAWDTMIAAHVLDNRPGVTGIEFQAFVLLGQEPWDAAVESYMKSSSDNSPNRLDEVDLRKLLVYNAMDALLEWKVAKIQMRRMGMGD